MKPSLFSKLQLSSAEIRQQFIDFFKEKGHGFVRSSPVVPHDDPSLLFTNAGMNQFKPYFIGTQKPSAQRVVNSQKCIRVSGKHNDLEEVGVDVYHHTFFEMLGNWSFGDYYKKEAIKWAWELLTEVWKLDKKLLWITIFEDDDESGELWRKHTDVDPQRVLKFGHKDNFWEMGETGPCGPCSEIHYYTGHDPENQLPEDVNVLSDYREIWNLVFIQYTRDENGELHDLPDKHVDTGAGLERLVAILNGKTSNYETDLFIPLLEKIVKITGKNMDFEDGVPHRVIADHLRMLSFSLADGAMPGNDGRGYVLRRILRRAARFGRLLEMKEPFIYTLQETLCQIMGESYPELIAKSKHIKKVICAEESAFNNTLGRGLEEFVKITSSMGSSSIISGANTFKLYDTFGFPLDLTQLMARENGFSVDIEQFNKHMIEQKERARNSGKFLYQSIDTKWIIVGNEQPTRFTGYKEQTSTGNIIKYKLSNESCEIVLDQTPFYAESGGQVGDKGYIKNNGFSMKVEDVQKVDEDFVHIGIIESGNIQNIESVKAQINEHRRKQIQRNHTATHLIHQTIKDVLGDHVQQAGSLVAPNYLRFDLTHYEQIPDDCIAEIETHVNTLILENLTVQTEIKDYKTAQNDGAISLFGEKYGDIVRVVNIPGFSKELCGGTHVSRTGDIGGIKIISETALASGIRRLVAVTGEEIIRLLTSQEYLLRDIRNELKCSKEDVFSCIQTLTREKKHLEKENKQLKQSSILDQIDNLVRNAVSFDKLRLVVKKVDDPGDLKVLGDQFRHAFRTRGISLIGTIQNNKPMVLCAVTDDLTQEIHAGDIVKEMGGIMGGGGGGKPHIATAGGSDVNLLQDALVYGENLIKSILSVK